MRSGLVILLTVSILSCVFGAELGARSFQQDPQQTQAQTQIKLQEAQDPQKKSEPSEAVISMETNLIVVNVTVTDALENYVAGLKIEDFKILEDLAPQRILDLTIDEAPFAAAILLDGSGSMGAKLSLARAACGNFLSELRDGDMAAVYSFGGFKVKKLQDFSESREAPDALWDMNARDDTPLYDAIVQAAEALAQRPERRRAIIVVSDGADTRSKASLDQATRKTMEANALIYAVDMSDRAVFKSERKDNGAEVMKMLAAKTGGRFIATPGGAQLRDAFAGTVEELRRQYTLTYESTNEKLDGKWRAIEVRLGRPGLNVRARQGYYARKK
ncbi:MAG TPA: VWA domain-containing protein [Blastocatellia bacterium]|jgi:Ca-activated chloride channel family protein|nr:VWA domain-containing protein [Blastocatellia bacterium]